MQRRKDPVSSTVVIHHSLLPPREPRPLQLITSDGDDDDDLLDEEMLPPGHWCQSLVTSMETSADDIKLEDIPSLIKAAHTPETYFTFWENMIHFQQLHTKNSLEACLTEKCCGALRGAYGAHICTPGAAVHVVPTLHPTTVASPFYSS